MVEHIVGFHAKLDVVIRIFTVLELLEERDVPVVHSRSAQTVHPRVVADAPSRSLRNAAGVDVSQQSAASTRQVGVAGQNDSRREVFATRGLPVSLCTRYSGQCVSERNGRTHGEAGESGHLPAAENLASERIVQERSG